MSGSLPPFYELSPDDRGPIVVVVGYTFVLTAVLLTVIRTVVVVVLKRGWSWDDACVLSGTVVGLVQTIVLERAVNSGLGRRMASLSDADIESYHKFTSAYQVLAILTMAMAKLSVLLLMLRLSPQIWLRRATHIIMIALAVWVVFSGIGLPLQCGTPGTTEYSAERCSLKGVLWYPVLLFNISTDFAVALLFIPVVLKLQMSKPRQTTVCLLFGSRIVVCVVGIAHLSILPSTLKAKDQTKGILAHAALLQVTMSLSIITATIPSLNPFFSELQIGSGTRVPQSHLGTNNPSYGSVHELSTLSGWKNRGRGIDSTCRNRKSRQIEPNCIPDVVSADRKLLHGWNSGEVDDAAEITTQRSDHSQVELRP